MSEKNYIVLKPADFVEKEQKGDQYCAPPVGYKGTNKWMNHSGYRIMVGAGRKPFFLNLIEQIKNRLEACIIVVTAKGGKGKTYIALRLAEILDPKFNPEIQVVYDQMQMLNIISDTSPLKHGQVVLVDEAQFSMSSRNWNSDLQKSLMQQMEAVRSKGLIIIIVTLGVDLLDIIMRKHVINFRLHVERKGVATVYSYDSHRFTGDEIVRKLGEVRFLLPDWEHCQNLRSCLMCNYSGLRKARWAQREKWEKMGFKPCRNMRVKYEMMKKLYVEEQNKKSVERAETAELKKQPLDKVAMVEYLINMPTPIKPNTKGNWGNAEVKIALNAEFKGVLVSRENINELKALCKAKRPDLFEK